MMINLNMLTGDFLMISLQPTFTISFFSIFSTQVLTSVQIKKNNLHVRCIVDFKSFPPPLLSNILVYFILIPMLWDTNFLWNTYPISNIYFFQSSFKLNPRELWRQYVNYVSILKSYPFFIYLPNNVKISISHFQ